MIPVENNSKIKWVEYVSYLMDEKFRLPGTNFRFGLDPLLNLIPLVGDLSGFAVSAVLVVTMAKHGASRKVIILMVINIILDTTIGAIPVIGQIFDFAYKSNSKNIKLLKEHYQEGRHAGTGNGIIAMVLFVLFLFLGLVVYAVWNLTAWFLGQF
jgi:hypothetical protein